MECQLSDITVYYEKHGDGHPVILLHGFGPDHHLMTGCMEPVFSKRDNWIRFYPDLPGMGKTPAKEWIHNSDQILDLVSDFIDTVIPDQNFLLVGESYGAYLARGIVHRKSHRIDGLFLLCPLIITDPTRRTLPKHVTLVKDPNLLSTLGPAERDMFESFSVVQNRAIWERSRNEVNIGLNAADEAFMTRIQPDGYAFSFDVDVQSKPFTKPTLILTGRQDAIVGYRDAWEILEKYPRATMAVLDRAGHNLQIEQEGLFNTLVNEWLDRVEENIIQIS
jgi:pimeloyl-ACP methyl ester carboxylesterase